MQYFFLGIALLVAFVAFGRWFVDAEPRKVAGALKWGGIGLVVVIGVLLVATGRIGLIFLLIPLILWARRLLSRAKAASGPTAGQSSEVRTRFLEMHLDHDTGDLDGRIIDGRYQGSLLSQLDLTALLQLLDDYQTADPQSASVLEAYLDRTQAEDWRAAAGGGEEAQNAGGGRRESQNRRAGAGGSGEMTRAEALEILGLEEGASAAAIREAHRRLMQKLHPDHGGSNYLAAKLNAAKELLLRH